ncbi:breast cancer type 2 susceptibility protein, partial [Kipferlia bialata]
AETTAGVSGGIQFGTASGMDARPSATAVAAAKSVLSAAETVSGVSPVVTGQTGVAQTAKGALDSLYKPAPIQTSTGPMQPARMPVTPVLSVTPANIGGMTPTRPGRGHVSPPLSVSVGPKTPGAVSGGPTPHKQPTVAPTPNVLGIRTVRSAPVKRTHSTSRRSGRLSSTMSSAIDTLTPMVKRVSPATHSHTTPQVSGNRGVSGRRVLPTEATEGGAAEFFASFNFADTLDNNVSRLQGYIDRVRRSKGKHRAASASSHRHSHQHVSRSVPPPQKEQGVYGQGKGAPSPAVVQSENTPWLYTPAPVSNTNTPGRPGKQPSGPLPHGPPAKRALGSGGAVVYPHSAPGPHVGAVTPGRQTSSHSHTVPVQPHQSSYSPYMPMTTPTLQGHNPYTSHPPRHSGEVPPTTPSGPPRVPLQPLRGAPHTQSMQGQTPRSTGVRVGNPYIQPSVIPPIVNTDSTKGGQAADTHTTTPDSAAVPPVQTGPEADAKEDTPSAVDQPDVSEVACAPDEAESEAAPGPVLPSPFLSTPDLLPPSDDLPSRRILDAAKALASDSTTLLGAVRDMPWPSVMSDTAKWDFSETVSVSEVIAVATCRDEPLPVMEAEAEAALVRRRLGVTLNTTINNAGYIAVATCPTCPVDIEGAVTVPYLPGREMTGEGTTVEKLILARLEALKAKGPLVPSMIHALLVSLSLKPSFSWTASTLPLCLWKLACAERQTYHTASPCFMLNVAYVLKDMVARYHRCFNTDKDPALYRITTKDDPPGRALVLLVCCTRGGKEGTPAGTPEALASNTCEYWIVSDGQYTIRARVDRELAGMASSGRITAGCKIVTACYNLTGVDDAREPWRLLPSACLVLHRNATLPAPPTSPMGYASIPLLPVPLDAASVSGGSVSMCRISVLSVLGVCVCERVPVEPTETNANPYPLRLSRSLLAEERACARAAEKSNKAGDLQREACMTALSTEYAEQVREEVAEALAMSPSDPYRGEALQDAAVSAAVCEVLDETPPSSVSLPIPSRAAVQKAVERERSRRRAKASEAVCRVKMDTSRDLSMVGYWLVTPYPVKAVPSLYVLTLYGATDPASLGEGAVVDLINVGVRGGVLRRLTFGRSSAIVPRPHLSKVVPKPKRGLPAPPPLYCQTLSPGMRVPGIGGVSGYVDGWGQPGNSLVYSDETCLSVKGHVMVVCPALGALVHVAVSTACDNIVPLLPPTKAPKDKGVGPVYVHFKGLMVTGYSTRNNVYAASWCDWSTLTKGKSSPETEDPDLQTVRETLRGHMLELVQ